MKNKRIILTMLVTLFYGVTALAQGGFNPLNPADPNMLYNVVARANDGNYTSGSGQYAVGTVVQINASAASTAFTFQYWKKNGVKQDGLSKMFNYTMTAENVNFEAVFAFTPDNPAEPQTINEYRLYLEQTPEGACSFNRTNGAKAEAGTQPTITAYANQGFLFLGWYNGNTKIGNTAVLTSFTMPEANTTLTARFAFNPISPEEPESSYSLGDVNKDRELNIMDVIGLTNYIMNPDGEIDTFLYDTNQDDDVNVMDVIRLVNKIMNNQ